MLVLGDCTVDLGQLRVERGDERIGLTAMEGKLLAYLAARPGQPVSRQQLLRDVWEYDERSSSRTVRTTINRLRNKVEADPGTPRHLLTVVGEGYKLEVAAATAPPDAFFGRSEERARLAELVDEHRLVTICGPAGIGKTRLALEAAGALSAGFVDLADVTDDVELTRALARALRVEPSRVGPALSARGTSTWVLDNFEQIAMLAPQIEAWLAEAPGVRFVVTSRVRLGLTAEVVLDLGPLDGDAAHALLVARAGKRWDVELTGPIVHRLEAHPLALELAAGWASLLDAQTIARRLEELDVIDVLASSLESSWELASNEDRTALRCLATFPTDAPLSAVEAVLGVGALRALRRLSDASWLRRTASGRVGMYVATRAFVQRRGVPESARTAHLAWAREHRDEPREHELVRAAAAWADEPALTELALALDDRSLLERAAVSPAVNRALARILAFEGDLDGARELLSAVADAPGEEGARVCIQLAHLDVADASFASATLAKAEDRIASEPVRVEWLLERARANQLAGDFDTARTDLRDAESLAERHAPDAIGRVLRQRGTLESMAGDLDAAQAAWRRAHALLAVVGSRHDLAEVEEGLADLILDREVDPSPAIAHYERAAGLYRADGDRAAELDVLRRLGDVFLELGQHAPAEQNMQRAAVLATTLGSDWRRAAVLASRARLTLDDGDDERSVALIDHCLDVLADLDLPVHTAIALGIAAAIYQVADHADALAMHDRALAAYEPLGVPRMEALLFLYRTLLEPDRDWFERARALALEIDEGPLHILVDGVRRTLEGRPLTGAHDDLATRSLEMRLLRRLCQRHASRGMSTH